MKSTTINPTLKDLEPFIGQWTTRISNASFLPSSSDTLESTATFEWFEDGDFLILRQGDKDTSHATWMIGHDQDTANYTVLYFDDRHFSRVYEMSFAGDRWKLWRNAPNFIQSFEAKISDDKNTITGAWSKSSDGKNWEHDFDLSYTRVK